MPQHLSTANSSGRLGPGRWRGGHRNGDGSVDAAGVASWPLPTCRRQFRATEYPVAHPLPLSVVTLSARSTRRTLLSAGGGGSRSASQAECRGFESLRPLQRKWRCVTWAGTCQSGTVAWPKTNASRNARAAGELKRSPVPRAVLRLSPSELAKRTNASPRSGTRMMSDELPIQKP